jgi:2-phosphoglycolate phosphatase
MPYKLLIFDLDGTLVDSYEAIQDALSHAMAALGFPPWPPEETKRRVGRGLEILMEEAVGAANVAEGVRLFRERYPAVFLEKTRVLPGVAETIPALKSRGKTLAVATNKPSDFSRRILDHLGLGRYFDLVLGPLDVARPKPHPDMLNRILADLEFRPDETLYIGDMTLDAESAANAGLACVLLATGGNGRSELEATGRPVLGSIDRILTWEEL